MPESINQLFTLDAIAEELQISDRWCRKLRTRLYGPRKGRLTSLEKRELEEEYRRHRRENKKVSSV